MVGTIDLDVTARLARVRAQPAGVLRRNPPVIRAVHDQQGTGRNRPHGVNQVQVRGHLVALADELGRGGGEEAGELVLDLAGVQIDHELTRFLATSPEEFLHQRNEVIAHLDPVDAVPSISPRPVLIVHGTDDRWVPVEHARRLYAHAGQPSRYVEIDGANHDFAWHRGELRELVCSWLDGTDV